MWAMLAGPVWESMWPSSGLAHVGHTPPDSSVPPASNCVGRSTYRRYLAPANPQSTRWQDSGEREALPAIATSIPEPALNLHKADKLSQMLKSVADDDDDDELASEQPPCTLQMGLRKCVRCVLVHPPHHQHHHHCSNGDANSLSRCTILHEQLWCDDQVLMAIHVATVQ